MVWRVEDQNIKKSCRFFLGDQGACYFGCEVSIFGNITLLSRKPSVVCCLFAPDRGDRFSSSLSTFQG